MYRGGSRIFMRGGGKILCMHITSAKRYVPYTAGIQCPLKDPGSSIGFILSIMIQNRIHKTYKHIVNIVIGGGLLRPPPPDPPLVDYLRMMSWV